MLIHCTPFLASCIEFIKPSSDCNCRFINEKRIEEEGIQITYEIRNDDQLGRILWMTDGKTEIAATLDVGIRIIHLSSCGKENLFYRQPEDLSDGLFRLDGWRIFGGHRLWFAPESEKSYYPDGNPVEYRIENEEVLLTQGVDPWMNIRKSVCLKFLPDGKISIRWNVENVGKDTIQGALWGINTLRGGTGKVNFSSSDEDPYRPSRAIQLWRNTDLGDERVAFHDDSIVVTHKLGCPYFKIGFFSEAGSIHHENMNQSFDIDFPVSLKEQYPDGGCNVEIWMSRYCMELEVLGPLVYLRPNHSTSLEVTWCVRNCE